MRSHLNLLSTGCGMLLAAIACAQTVQVQPGTTLQVQPGTTVQFNGALILATAPTASVVNDGLIVLSPDAVVAEAPGAPITGLGIERFTRTYPAPLSATEPGGLGLRVSTALAPGAVMLERDHVPRVEPGGASSIARWYTWNGAVNTGLDASVALRYDPVLLNGIPETDQVLHILQSNTFWHALPSAVNTSAGEVTATDLDSLGTLTTFAGALTTGLAERVAEEGAVLVPTLAETEVQLIALPAQVDRSVRVLDAAGRTVHTTTLSSGTTGSRLAVFSYAPGLYTVLVDGLQPLLFMRP